MCKYKTLGYTELFSLHIEHPSYQVNIVTSNILVYIHYDGDKMINDIALIKLAKPVDISGTHCYTK